MARAFKPSIYVKEMRDGGGDVDGVLQSHLIRASELEADDYPAFIKQRLNDFVSKIEEVTGVKVAPLTTTEGTGEVAADTQDEEES